MRGAFSIVVLAVFFSVGAAAQSPAPAAVPPGSAPARAASATQPAAPSAQAPAAAPPNTRPSTEAYTYDPAGRRDPFVNLLGTGDEKNPVARKGDGAAGLSVLEISVRGVMQSRGGLVAMVQGPENKTYIVHQGDKFLDGHIKSITPQGLVIMQEINDPLSSVKQREIRKYLRAQEDGKE